MEQKSSAGDSGGGIWIGIDLGTSNSACAVWDSTRGSAKWMRLETGIAGRESSSGKAGRICPSVIRRLGEKTDIDAIPVGVLALQANDDGTLISSVKRLLGKQRLGELDSHWLDSLPYTVVEDKEQGLIIQAGDGTNIYSMTPVEVLSIILRSLRQASQSYLDKYAGKKRLQVPGASWEGRVRHVVVGVPAHFSKRHVDLVKEACHQAGFDGTISTCMESTAAAMAYGLTLQETSKDANIMVVDMGGGTTDITIATKQEHLDSNDEATAAPSYKVLVTEGNACLGGDDIDQALLDYYLDQLHLPNVGKKGQDELRRSCRAAKERLCDAESPSDSEQVAFQKQRVYLTQETFEKTLQPWLDSAQSLIQRALKQFKSISDTHVEEVILVGGTTRIPAVRRLIQGCVPNVELCTSLHPMSSVAQGLAIQAAIVSKQVPVHELKSALMLDCIPHAIGVALPHNGRFVEILPRNASLPARGSVTFLLADKYQPGISIHAVEKVGSNKYEPMALEDFTFLLRRLSPKEYDQISSRSVEVGMKVDQDGQFIVSIFDNLDPEQVRKKERYEKRLMHKDDPVGELHFIADLVMAETSSTREQVLLTGVLIVVVVAYFAVRIAFHQVILDDDVQEAVEL